MLRIIVRTMIVRRRRWHLTSLLLSGICCEFLSVKHVNGIKTHLYSSLQTKQYQNLKFYTNIVPCFASYVTYLLRKWDMYNIITQICMNWVKLFSVFIWFFSKPTPVAELLALQKSQKSAVSSKHKGANLELSSSEDSGLPKVSDFEMAQLKRQMECVSKEIHLCRIQNQVLQKFNCLFSMNR